jgi:hypothetical protein
MNSSPGRSALQLTHPGNGSQQTASKRIQRGIIKAAVITHVLGTLQVGHAWGRLWLATSRASRENVLAALVEDYITDQSFAWDHMDIPVPRNSFLVLDVWSSVAADFRAAVLIAEAFITPKEA